MIDSNSLTKDQGNAPLISDSQSEVLFAPSFVDLNGDGLVDVVTSRPDNTVTFFW
jgi:hypothetical protein